MGDLVSMSMKDKELMRRDSLEVGLVREVPGLMYPSWILGCTDL